MALRVDSSSTSTKVVFGIAAFAALGVGTVLFLRSRGNFSARSAFIRQRTFCFLS